MNVLIPIFLLLLFILTFWLLSDSKLSKTTKISAIIIFFSFCAIFYKTTDTFTGWAAKYQYLPKIITLRHVVIKEPNHQQKIYGGIYFLIDEPPSKYDSIVLKIFGYKTEYYQPKLYRLNYSRNLHEKLAKDIIPRLQSGQIIRGRLDFKNKVKDKYDKKGKGNGDESHKMPEGPMFYELNPSFFLQKPPQ